MTFKVGNTEINAVSIVESFDPPIDEPTMDYEPHLKPWVRPSEWLDMPVINSGEEKIAMLLYVISGVPVEPRIYIQGTHLGGYSIRTHSTIDWGDGTTVVMSGSDTRSTSSNWVMPAHHVYKYENLPESSEFIKDGQTVRQAMIQIDNSVSGCYYFSFIGLPNELESSFRSNPHNSYTYEQFGKSTLLDLHISSQTMKSCNFATDFRRSVNVDLERVVIDIPHSLDTAGGLFRSCISLQNVSFPSGFVSSASNLSTMFYDCRRLQQIPYFDSSSATTMADAFSKCYSLKTVPDLDTSNVAGTGFRYIFSNCLNLKEIPRFDYSNGTDFSGSFASMRSLEYIPTGLDFSNATNTYSMFSSCSNLKVMPNDFFDNFTNVTDTRQMFYYCRSLLKMPRIHFPNTTNMRDFAYACASLRKLHLGDLSKVRSGASNYWEFDFFRAFSACVRVKKIVIDYPEKFIARSYSNMFSSLVNLKEAPYFNTSSGVRLDSLYGGCANLREVPSYDFSSCERIDGIFSSCFSLREIGAFRNVNTKLTNASIAFRDTYVLEKLPSGLFQDFNSSPSYFREAFVRCGIQELPDMNLSGINTTSTNQQGFYGASNVRSIGNLTIGSGTNCRSLFTGLDSLRYVPEADMSLAYDCNNMFGSCRSLQWCDLTNIPKSISFYNDLLGSGAITHIFNNLVSGVTGQSIDVRYNYGAVELHPDTIAIATNKGWSVLT